MRLVRPISLLVAGATLLTGCASSSKFVNMWKSPDFTGTLSNVMVIGVGRDNLLRRGYEDSMVREMAAIGVKATASYSILPDEKIEKDAILRAVSEGKYDGVIAARLVSVDEKETYVPGYVTTYPGYYGPWGGWYGGWYGTTYSPGYMTSDTIARLETQVWDVRGEGKMVWAGMSESVNPQEAKNIAGEVAAITVETLQKAGILPKK